MKPISVWIKRVICVVFLLHSVLNMEAQDVLKYTAYSVSYGRISPEDSSVDWSERVDVNELVVLNLEKGRLSIYSKEKQEYDFISEAEEVVLEDGRKNFCFYCIDKNGEECVVFLWYEDGNGCRGISIVQGVSALFYEIVVRK